MKRSWVYIISNEYRTVLYTGITNDIERRILEHKAMVGAKFPSQFKCIDLIYLQEYNDIEQAISFEKRLKKWKRDWKEQLIKEFNPSFSDLAHDWYSPEEIVNMKDEAQLPSMKPTPIKYYS